MASGRRARVHELPRVRVRGRGLWDPLQAGAAVQNGRGLEHGGGVQLRPELPRGLLGGDAERKNKNATLKEQNAEKKRENSEAMQMDGEKWGFDENIHSF